MILDKNLSNVQIAQIAGGNLSEFCPNGSDVLDGLTWETLLE